MKRYKIYYSDMIEIIANDSDEALIKFERCVDNTDVGILDIQEEEMTDEIHQN